MTNEDREFLDKYGICTRCRKAKRAIGFKQCPECLEKEMFRAQKRRDDATPEMRAAENAKQRERYYQRKAEKICVRCGKPATHGMYCLEHFARERRLSSERARKRYWENADKVGVRQYRLENRLCWCCGAPIEEGNSTKVCNACREKLSERLAMDGGWRKYDFKFGRGLYEPAHKKGQAGTRAGEI